MRSSGLGSPVIYRNLEKVEERERERDDRSFFFSGADDEVVPRGARGPGRRADRASNESEEEGVSGRNAGRDRDGWFGLDGWPDARLKSLLS